MYSFCNLLFQIHFINFVTFLEKIQIFSSPERFGLCCKKNYTVLCKVHRANNNSPFPPLLNNAIYFPMNMFLGRKTCRHTVAIICKLHAEIQGLVTCLCLYKVYHTFPPNTIVECHKEYNRIC